MICACIKTAAWWAAIVQTGVSITAQSRMLKRKLQLPETALRPLNQPPPVNMDYRNLVRHLASPPAVHWGSACQGYWLAADVQPTHKTVSASQPVTINSA